MSIIRNLLMFIGLVTVVWFIVIAYDEYMKLKSEKENKDG